MITQLPNNHIAVTVPEDARIAELMREEIWVDVPEHEGCYQISTHSRVRSVTRVMTYSNGRTRRIEGRILKRHFNPNCYQTFTISNGIGPSSTLVLHISMAKIFIPNPENKKEVNHKNGIKSDCSLTNLEWTTSSENKLHAYNTGLMPRRKGRHSHRFGKTGLQVANAKKCQCLATGRVMAYADAIRELSISQAYFSRMMAGVQKNWTHFHSLSLL